MSDETFYLTRYSCPLFVANTDRMTLDLVGTSVPVSASGRLFLITAGHVVDRYTADGLLYPTDRESSDLVGVCGDFVGTTYTSVPGTNGFDDMDLAIMEVPPGQLSNVYTPVPSYMVAASISLKHVDEISLIGYPVTRNKYRYNSRRSTVRSIALVLPHERSKYDALGLNPLTHFCARFNHKGMKGEDGRVFIPPDPHGLSGGPAWHVGETAKRTRTDEGASLLGIVSEYDPHHKVIWGPRMSHVFRTLAETFPKIADGFRVLMKQRTLDPDEIRYYYRAARNT